MERKLHNYQTLISSSKVKEIVKKFWWLTLIGLFIAISFVLYEYKIGEHSNIDAVKTNITIYIDSSDAEANIKNDHVQEAGIMADSLQNIKSNQVLTVVNKRLKEQGINPLEIDVSSPEIFYEYATSKTATLQFKSLDPDLSRKILYAYVYSLNQQPQEILKGTKIKILGENISNMESTKIKTGISVMRVALIFALSIVLVALIFVMLVLFDKRIWSEKDILMTYTGINFGSISPKSNDIKFSLIEKIRIERDLVGIVIVLANGNLNYSDVLDGITPGVRMLNGQDYGSIKMTEGVIIGIEKGTTTESELENILSQLREINIDTLGFIFCDNIMRI